MNKTLLAAATTALLVASAPSGRPAGDDPGPTSRDMEGRFISSYNWR